MDTASRNRLLIFLTLIIGALILIISLSEIMTFDGGDFYLVTSMRGDSVELFGGEGLYRYDTIDKALMNHAFDWINIFIGIPLLIMGMILYRRETKFGTFLYPSILFYFIYNYMIGLYGNAYNVLFLAYCFLIALSLFTFIISIKSVNYDNCIRQIQDGFSRKSLSIYMLIAGIALLAMYLSEIIQSMISREALEAVATYTTYDIAGQDLSFAIPLYIIGGILLIKKRVEGYVITTIFVFMSCITFSALVLYGFIQHFGFDIPSIPEMIQMGLFLIISLIFSIKIVMEMKIPNHNIEI